MYLCIPDYFNAEFRSFLINIKDFLMKSFSLLIVTLLMVALSATAGKVEHVYHFGNPSVRQSGDYQMFDLSNTMLTALPGQPVLPYRQVNLMLPPGEAAVSIEIIFSDEVSIPGNIKLAPQQEVRPVSSTIQGNFIKNEVIYNQNAFLPSDPKGKLITAFLNGRSFALTTFSPARYNPVTGQLSYYATAHIIITTASDTKAVQALENLSTDSPDALLLAENKEMEQEYLAKQRKSATNNYELLIITTSAFASSFGTLQSDYLNEGIISSVVTKESINTLMTGVDIQEKIRNYIIQEYQTHGVKYVMLAGDDELIPHRGFYCYVQSGAGYIDQDIPADLYYSALDGNWNTNGDAKWGEPGEDDLLPDIAVARLPFSNASELSHMLNKTIKYQFSPIDGEFRNILMAGEHLYDTPITWGSDYLNLLIGERSDNGYSTIGLPVSYNFDYLYDETTTWSPQDLMNHLNMGRPMLNHVGHANESTVMKFYNSDITDANFSGLNGVTHNFTIIYTHGCYCGAFDYSDCIAEKTVSINNFAAAFIGNSRYGWFNEGQTEGPSAHLHREYMDALFHDKQNRIGRAHMESKIATASWVTAPGQWEPGALRWCFYDCNVLGDPALAVFTDNPITVNATYPAIVLTGASTMTVNITVSGAAATGFTCVVMQGGVVIGKTMTGLTGQAIISLDLATAIPGQAQLIVSGYNCIPTTFNFAFLDPEGTTPLSEKTDILKISPNPASEKLTIDTKLGSSDDFTMQIFDSNGKLVKTIKANSTNSNGTSHQVIDISTLKAGYYSCVLRSRDLNVSKSFIVK